MLKMIAQVTLCGVASFGVVSCMTSAPSPAYYAVMVDTFDGNTVEGGAGRSCEIAWEHAVIPENWREIRCEQVR